MKTRVTLLDQPLESSLSRIVLSSSESRTDIWTFLQLADSAFPTGGFAHSAGLEAAWQHGEVRNATDLRAYLAQNLSQAAQASAPFATTAHSEPDRLLELDELCDVWTTNHVANRASRVQGKSFMNAVERVFNLKLKPALATNFHGHYAPTFGVAAAALGFTRNEMLELFAFMHLRTLTSSAVRLGIVGPTAGQDIQRSLGPELSAFVQRADSLTIEDLAQTAPLIDLWQGAQDRLYSRLFQS